MAPNRVTRATAMATARDYAKNHSKEAVRVQAALYRDQVKSLNRAKANASEEEVRRLCERIADTRELLRAFEREAQ
ncbi:MAG: hypothetical protein ACM685_22035 [Enterobacteriaceae bacterium]|jgi:hypothetical protein|nr:MAG TPA: hypothetical protein [Caudoviricetes sp.]